MTQSICFWGFIGGAIGMVLRSRICHLKGRLAEPTHSAAQGYKAGKDVIFCCWQVWHRFDAWSCISEAEKVLNSTVHEECDHLKCTHSPVVSVPLEVQHRFKALKSAAHSLQTKLVFIPILHFYPEKFSLYVSNWESSRFHCLIWLLARYGV